MGSEPSRPQLEGKRILTAEDFARIRQLKAEHERAAEMARRRWGGGDGAAEMGRRRWGSGDGTYAQARVRRL